MSKARQGTMPFKIGGPLSVDDPACSTIVYEEPEYLISAPEMVNCVPQVICSPKQTGKTTFLNQMCYKQNDISSLQNETCDVHTFPIKEEMMSEERLRSELQERLMSPSEGALTDMLEKSKLMGRGSTRKVFAIIDADNLSNEALNWLLFGIRRMVEEPGIPDKLRIQVIVDGSFAVDTLTGPNSTYPIPQKFPKEFSQEQQRKFVVSGFSTLNFHLESEAHQCLWEHTHGDKYLTQALSMMLVQRYEMESTVARSSVTRISVGEVENTIVEFVSGDPQNDPLKSSLLHCFADLHETFEGDEYQLRDLLKQTSDEWTRTSLEAKRIAYKGGIVRRISDDQVALRAPLVAEIYSNAEPRVRQIRAVLNMSLALDGIPSPYKLIAQDAVKQIIQSAFLNSLRILHVGTGRKINEREVEIKAVAVGQGEYTGRWEIETERSIKVGDEVWCLLWSWEENFPMRARKSNLLVFPMICNISHLGDLRLC